MLRGASAANPGAGDSRTPGAPASPRGRVVLALTLGLLIVRLATTGAAQGADHAAAAAQSPAPVTLTLRFQGGRTQFKPGETLAIELEFDSRIPKRFIVDGATYDRSGRLTIDDFSVEPDDAVTDPLADYFASGDGFIGGGIRGMGVLGDKPFTVTLALNEWMRFDKAGTYKISVRSQRVSDDAKATGARESIVPVESNSVSFEILPRDAEWESSELDRALEILTSTGIDVNRQAGCRKLRFLGTPAAVDELIAHPDDDWWRCGFDGTAALFGAPDRDRIVRLLESGLRESDRSVSESSVHTLAVLSVFARHPELRPARTRTAGPLLRPPDELRQLRDLVEAAQATYTEILDAALPEKTAKARAMILSWRLDSGRRPESGFSAAAAAARDRLREQLVATFLELPAERQASLLGHQWRSIAVPAMVPVLRVLIERPAPGPESLADLALRRLYELAPEEGRARILGEIGNPSRGATLKTLGVLPDRELPQLDNVIAASVETNQGDLELHAELLQRYGSAAISARVLSRAGDRIGRLACRPQAAFLAYFVRTVPVLGSALLDRALLSREVTGCYQSVLRDVAALHMTADLEAAAVAHLDDPDPEVVRSAAETLGRHGSRSSLQPLRARFERWHRTWEGRQEELRYSYARPLTIAREGMVEWALFQALGRGEAWLTEEPELRELRALCVTDNCRTQADQMIRAAADRRIAILQLDGPDNSFVNVAQYDLASIPALERKLAQYPKGSTFTLDARTLDPQTAALVASELARFADAQGIALRR